MVRGDDHHFQGGSRHEAALYNGAGACAMPIPDGILLTNEGLRDLDFSERHIACMTNTSSLAATNVHLWPKRPSI